VIPLQYGSSSRGLITSASSRFRLGRLRTVPQLRRLTLRAGKGAPGQALDGGNTQGGGGGSGVHVHYEQTVRGGVVDGGDSGVQVHYEQTVRGGVLGGGAVVYRCTMSKQSGGEC